MTGMAVAGRRLNAATVLAAMMLMTAGLVIGFALAQIVSVGNLTGTDVQNRAPVGIQTPGRFGGLSPDDRQDLTGTGQAKAGQQAARFGGVSPDDRQDLTGTGQAKAGQQAARFGGLSPDERESLA